MNIPLNPAGAVDGQKQQKAGPLEGRSGPAKRTRGEASG